MIFLATVQETHVMILPSNASQSWKNRLGWVGRLRMWFCSYCRLRRIIQMVWPAVKLHAKKMDRFHSVHLLIQRDYEINEINEKDEKAFLAIIKYGS